MSHVDMAIHADTPSADAATVPVKVWDVPTRVFHWSLAASFAGAWITAESERWRDLHVMLGYTLAGLIAFRLVWGVIGSRYARFSSFVFPPSRVVAYLKSLFSGSPEHHVGHNPAGALAIFGLLVLGIVVAASGYANYQEIGGEWVEELHEGAANAMLGLVIIHLLGVLVSSVLHRENLARSMLSGFKRGHPGEGVARMYPVLGGVLLVAVLGFWAFAQTPGGQAWLGGNAEASGIGQRDSGRTAHAGEHREKRGKHGQRDRDDD